MYRVLKWLLSGGAVFLIGAAAATAGAAQGLNILIVPAAAHGGDGGELQDWIAGQVRRMVMTRLAGRGHAVFDGDSIADARPGPALKASLAAAIAGRVAKSLSAGLDAIIVVSAKIGIRRGAYTSHMEARFGASLMDGRTGRFLAQVESRPSRRRLTAACGKSCLADVAAGEAEAALEMLVAAIARNLAKMPRRAAPTNVAPAKPQPERLPGYVLVFRGLGPEEIAGIEKYLTVFPGFGEMQRSRGADGGVVYRYRSELDGPALEGALGRMLGHLRIAALVERTGRRLVIGADRSARKSNDW